MSSPLPPSPFFPSFFTHLTECLHSELVGNIASQTSTFPISKFSLYERRQALIILLHRYISENFLRISKCRGNVKGVWPRSRHLSSNLKYEEESSPLREQVFQRGSSPAGPQVSRECGEWREQGRRKSSEAEGCSEARTRWQCGLG